jgi:hypothetical protein
MRLKILATIVALTPIIACDRQTMSPLDTAPEAVFPPEVLALSPAHRSISPAESVAISRVASQFTGLSAQIVRERLENPNIVIRFPKNPSVQRLADEVYAARRGEDVAVASSARVVPALVILAEKLRDSTADAIVIRRANEEDVILLREGHASVEALGAAVSGLYAMRKVDGDSAKQNRSLVVHNAKLPRHWAGFLEQSAGRMLTSLNSAPHLPTAHYGRVKRSEIALLGTSR